MNVDVLETVIEDPVYKEVREDENHQERNELIQKGIETRERKQQQQKNERQSQHYEGWCVLATIRGVCGEVVCIPP